jgi:hypothetical protein
MEISSAETSVHKKSTRRHITEDGIIHSHRRENLKSYNKNIGHGSQWGTKLRITVLARASSSLTDSSVPPTEEIMW